MLSFSPPYLRSGLPLPMWLSSICIVAVSRRCSLMRIASRTVIGGVPTRRTVRRFGKSFRSGYGIYAKNSASSGNPPQCVSLSFPPPQTKALPSPHPTPAGPSFGPAQWARAARVGSLGGQDFLPQADGTLRCQQGPPLHPHVRRPEHHATTPALYPSPLAP